MVKEMRALIEANRELKKQGQGLIKGVSTPAIVPEILFKMFKKVSFCLDEDRDLIDIQERVLNGGSLDFEDYETINEAGDYIKGLYKAQKSRKQALAELASKGKDKYVRTSPLTEIEEEKLIIDYFYWQLKLEHEAGDYYEQF